MGMTIIGVAGGTASGKTTLVNEVLNGFDTESVGLIAQDAYYKDNSHLSFDQRCDLNYDHPKAIDFDLMIHQIKDLKQGRSIDRPCYDFKTHNRTHQTIEVGPKKILIVEGILVLHDPKLRALMDLKVYVDAPEDIRLKRRMQRDIAQRGRDAAEVTARFNETLKPMHDAFIEPSKAEADLVIPSHRENRKGVQVLQNYIQSHLTPKS